MLVLFMVGTSKLPPTVDERKSAEMTELLLKIYFYMNFIVFGVNVSKLWF